MAVLHFPLEQEPHGAARVCLDAALVRSLPAVVLHADSERLVLRRIERLPLFRRQTRFNDGGALRPFVSM